MVEVVVHDMEVSTNGNKLWKKRISSVLHSLRKLRLCQKNAQAKYIFLMKIITCQ